MAEQQDIFDLFVNGGGVNGTGIARDAVGRGLSVMLAEKGDLASATSSGSTKLFHGGLRYLEDFKLRLVRESLIEREVLLRAMPGLLRRRALTLASRRPKPNSSGCRPRNLPALPKILCGGAASLGCNSTRIRNRP